MKMRKSIAIVLLVLLVAIPFGSAFAEKITIVDSTTGKTLIYDTDTKTWFDQDKPQNPAGTVVNSGKTPLISGLNYSEDVVGDETARRAIIGEGYIIEAQNFALKGAARVLVKEGAGGSKDIYIVDKSGNIIHSHGVVYVYMLLPSSIIPPYRVLVDGVYTTFEAVPGTNYVKFTGEF